MILLLERFGWSGKKTVLFVIIIVIAYTVVSITTGSPIERVQFRSNVTDYLHKMYTMNWKIDSVDYDFKNDKFIANVISDSGISFWWKKTIIGK